MAMLEQNSLRPSLGEAVDPIPPVLSNAIEGDETSQFSLSHPLHPSEVPSNAIMFRPRSVSSNSSV